VENLQFFETLGLDVARKYRVDGNDLHVQVLLAPWEAALGAVVPVDLPDGPINVRIPEGTRPGRPLRIRGKGLPADTPGDLYLEITIVAPAANTARAQQLYEALAEETRFNPRTVSRGADTVAD
jgi:curved DNA-binding protein